MTEIRRAATSAPPQANKSLHALYALDTGAVTVNNLGGSRQPGVSVESRVYDLAGRLLDDRRTGPLTVSSQRVIMCTPPKGARGYHGAWTRPACTSSSYSCATTAARSSTETSTGCRPSGTP